MGVLAALVITRMLRHVMAKGKVKLKKRESHKTGREKIVLMNDEGRSARREKYGKNQVVPLVHRCPTQKKEAGDKDKEPSSELHKKTVRHQF